MSVESILEISKLGMQYEMMRTEIASAKIARANIPLAQGERASTRQVDSGTFSQILMNGLESSGNPVNFAVIESAMGTRKAFEPNHPMADEKGFVVYPDIDVAQEFVTMTLAKRAYEANIRVFNNAAKMHTKALEIGRA